MATSIEDVKHQYPGREDQITSLAEQLSLTSIPAPLFIYGPQTTGKTSVVRDLLSSLSLRHVYINCNYVNRTRAVLTSIVHQLRRSKRYRSEGYEFDGRCDNISDFFVRLPSLLSAQQHHKSTSTTTTPPFPAWIVLDNAHRIAGTELLISLMRLADVTGASIGLILISPVSWASGVFSRDSHGIVPPVHIGFPSYTAQQLTKIILLRKALWIGTTPPPTHTTFFPQCVSSITNALHRTTNNILDVQTAIDIVWPKYIQPIDAGKKLSKEQLYGRIRGELQRIIAELDLSGPAVIAHGLLLVVDDKNNNATNTTTTAAGTTTNNTATATAGATIANNNNTTNININTAAFLQGQGIVSNEIRASNRGLALELPFLSKHLLLAAFIASRNKPTSDRAVFDPSFVKRGRKDAQASDKRAEAALDASLKGPHTFPLERLLHIFYCLYHASGGGGDEDDNNNNSEEEEEQEEDVVVEENISTIASGSRSGRQSRGGATTTTTTTKAAAKAAPSNGTTTKGTIGTRGNTTGTKVVTGGKKRSRLNVDEGGGVVEAQHAEVMMQLSTLVSLRLLSHSGGDLLEGSVYRCNLNEEVATTIAGNLKLKLQEYLRY